MADAIEPASPDAALTITSIVGMPTTRADDDTNIDAGGTRDRHDQDDAAPSKKRRPPQKRRRSTKRQRVDNDNNGNNDDSGKMRDRQGAPAVDETDLISLIDLPTEIALLILSHCSAVDIARLGLACHWGAAIVADPMSMRDLYRRAVGAPCAHDPLCLGRFGDVVDSDYFGAADPAPLNVVRLADCALSATKEGRIFEVGHTNGAHTKGRLGVDCKRDDDDDDDNDDHQCARNHALDSNEQRHADTDNTTAGFRRESIINAPCNDNNGTKVAACSMDDSNTATGHCCRHTHHHSQWQYQQQQQCERNAVVNNHIATFGPDGRRHARETRIARKQAVVSASACGMLTPVEPAERLGRDDPRMPCGRRAGTAEIAAIMEETVWRCGHLPPSLVEAIGPLRAMALADAVAESATTTRRGSTKKRGGARLVKTIRRTGLGHTSTVAWGFWREGRLVGPGLVARASCRADVGARFDARWALLWEDDMTRSDGRYRPGPSAPFAQRTWRIVGARTGATVTCGDATGALGAAMTSTTEDGGTVSALVGPATRASAHGTTVIIGPGRVVRLHGSRAYETVAPLVGVDEMDACLWTPSPRSEDGAARSIGIVRCARTVPSAGTDVAVYRGAVDASDRPHGHGTVYALDVSADRETVVYEGAWQGGVAHGWGRLFDPTLPAEAHCDARPLFVGYFCKGAPVGSGSLSPAPGCIVEAAGWWASSEDDDTYTPAPRGAGVIHLPCGAQLTCDWQRAGAPPVVHAVRHRDAALGRAVDAGDCTIVVDALDVPDDNEQWAAAIEQVLLQRTDALCQMAPLVPQVGSRTAARWMGSALTTPSLRFRVRCGESPDAIIVVDLAAMVAPWPSV